MKKALHRSSFLREELFSSDELEYCDGAAAPEQHLAGRWAAKEACLKAFGLSTLSYELRKLEVVHGTTGKPALRVHCPTLREDMRRAADSPDYQLQLSLSHDADYAVACVLVMP